MCTLFVMPSTDEAFGVAYIEAMAGGLPAIGCRGEPGPEEIAAAGDGLVLVPPGRHRAPDPAHRRAPVRPPPAARGRAAGASDRRRALLLGALRSGDARRLPAHPAVKPVLFATGHAPAYRVGAFARLHELEDIEVVLFGGRYKHGGGASEGDLPFPHRHVRQRELAALARERPLPRRGVPHRRSRGAAGHVAGHPSRTRAADPVGLAVGAPAQRRARTQLPPAAPPLPLGRRGGHLWPARQRLRAGTGRAQRARRPAVRRQRLLERTGGRGPAARTPGPHRRRRSSFMWVAPLRKRGWMC